MNTALVSDLYGTSYRENMALSPAVFKTLHVITSEYLFHIIDMSKVQQQS